MEWEGRPATVSFLADISELKAAEQALAEHVHSQEEVIAARTASLRETNDRLAAEAARTNPRSPTASVDVPDQHGAVAVMILCALYLLFMSRKVKD